MVKTPNYDENHWDGHTTDQKYERLSKIKVTTYEI